jgi:phosphatidylglycerol:prolipoprotein diacylglycerol transferase
MHRTLFHIYGPFAIHSFGLMIALGLVIFAWLIQRHPTRSHIITQEKFIDALLLGIVVALAGGRLLYVISEWHTITSWPTIFYIWDGGLSLLGSIISTVLIMPIYLRRNHIPVLPLLDLVALYTPLLQAISRLGCFAAGCCYGAITNVPWAIMYTDADSIAPLGVHLHPSQLYSSALLLLIFIFLYCYLQYRVTHPGQLLAWYLLLAGTERFMIDFFRGDRTICTLSWFEISLGIHQWIALGIIAVACILLVAVSRTRTRVA